MGGGEKSRMYRFSSEEEPQENYRCTPTVHSVGLSIGFLCCCFFFLVFPLKVLSYCCSRFFWECSWVGNGEAHSAAHCGEASTMILHSSDRSWSICYRYIICLQIVHLDPNLPSLGIVQDLWSLDPTRQTLPRSCMIHGSHPATWPIDPTDHTDQEPISSYTACILKQPVKHHPSINKKKRPRPRTRQSTYDTCSARTHRQKSAGNIWCQPIELVCYQQSCMVARKSAYES